MTDSELPEIKSKSQLKRESQACTDLGEELMSLTEAQRAQLPLPDDVRDALAQIDAMNSHGARRRQKLFIGKLLRDTDTAPIQAALDAFRTHGHASALRHQHLERWRDRLIAEGDAAFDDFLAEFPHTDRGQLRRLVRGTQLEREQGSPPKNARALFRYLRELAESPSD